MKKKHNLYILGVIVALALFLIYTQEPRPTQTQTGTVPALKASVANLELSYPDTYAVYEKTNSPYTKTLNTVVWYENTPSNRDFFVGAPTAPGEPPVTMSLDVYSNPNNLSPQNLLSKDVPYMFVKGQGVPVTLAGLPGILLEWDSLYRGRSVMVNDRGLTYVFSVTSITNQDAILRDFDLMLGSVVFK